MIQKHKHIIIAAFVMLASGISFASSQSMVKINDAARFASHKLGKIDVYHNNGEFQIMHNNKMHTVENHCLDKPLREINTKQLATFLAHGHLAINKTDSGEFTIRANDHLKGGGALGATIGCWTGRFVTQAIGYSIVAPIIALPALVGGPVAYGIAVAGAAGTIAPIVESASTAAAIAGGMIGAVVTGPA